MTTITAIILSLLAISVIVLFCGLILQITSAHDFVPLCMVSLIFSGVFFLIAVLGQKSVSFEKAINPSVGRSRSAVVLEGSVDGRDYNNTRTDAYTYINAGKPGFDIYVKTRFNHFGRELDSYLVVLPEKK